LGLFALGIFFKAANVKVANIHTYIYEIFIN
jgi:hypothetical protein